MNCTDARARLPLLLYDDLPPAEARLLRDHLAACPACRAELEALRGLRQGLDALPTPAAGVDLPRLYRDAADRSARRLRWWRRSAVAAAAAAAAVLALALLPRLEVRREPGLLVLRWGPPAAPPPPPVPPAPMPRERPTEAVAGDTAPPAETRERLRLLGELVQALATDIDLRDARRQQELAALRAQVEGLRRQLAQARIATERDMAAFYAAVFPQTRKGASP